MLSIGIRNLKKNLGQKQTLGPLELEVAAGEFLTVVGPADSGKSMLLRILAGLEEHGSDTVFFEGKDAVNLSPKERGVAMLFADDALYPHMSVQDNLSFVLRMSDLPVDELNRRTHEAARLLRLTPILSQRPAQLSLEQRQRVAMARALARQPALCLFDEPLARMPRAERSSLRAELALLHRQCRMTSVYATQDPKEAMSLGDRVLVLRNGQMEQLATPEQIYRFPVSKFVALFFGMSKMNILPASYLPAKLLAHGATEVGFRAEAALLSRGELSKAHLVGQAKLILIEHFGERSLLHLQLPSEHVVLCELTDISDYVVGDELAVSVHAEDLYHFDQLGKAIYPA